MHRSVVMWLDVMHTNFNEQITLKVILLSNEEPETYLTNPN